MSRLRADRDRRSKFGARPSLVLVAQPAGGGIIFDTEYLPDYGRHFHFRMDLADAIDRVQPVTVVDSCTYRATTPAFDFGHAGRALQKIDS